MWLNKADTNYLGVVSLKCREGHKKFEEAISIKKNGKNMKTIIKNQSSQGLPISTII